LLLPNYKNHFKVLKKYKRNGPKMDFQICKFLPFFGPPYHALTLFKILFFGKINHSHNLVLCQAIQTQLELCILPLCFKIVNNKFNQLGLQICNKFRWKGHFLWEFYCMSVTSIIMLAYMNIFQGMNIWLLGATSKGQNWNFKIPHLLHSF